ncbi:MAG: IS6 family transposase [Acidobacteriaceae bacterium]|nr:IS6 family transposase [Acidobacteriaceae bacterium]
MADTSRRRSSSHASVDIYGSHRVCAIWEELTAERGLRIDHTTIWRWTQIYGPEAQRRLHGQVRYKRSSWHIDETYITAGGRTIQGLEAVHMIRKRQVLGITRRNLAAQAILSGMLFDL